MKNVQINGKYSVPLNCRYAYAPICGHHVDLLVEALLSSSAEDNVYLRALLHRLSGLLSAASRDKVGLFITDVPTYSDTGYSDTV